MMILLIVQSSMVVAEFHGFDPVDIDNAHSSLEYEQFRYVDSIDDETNIDSDSELKMLDCQHCGHCHVVHFYMTSDLFSYSFYSKDSPLLRSAHSYSYPNKSPDNPPPIS